MSLNRSLGNVYQYCVVLCFSYWVSCLGVNFIDWCCLHLLYYNCKYDKNASAVPKVIITYELCSNNYYIVTCCILLWMSGYYYFTFNLVAKMRLGGRCLVRGLPSRAEGPGR